MKYSGCNWFLAATTPLPHPNGGQGIYFCPIWTSHFLMRCYAMIPVISSYWLFHFYHTLSELLMMQLVNETAAVEMQQSSLQTAHNLLRAANNNKFPSFSLLHNLNLNVVVLKLRTSTPWLCRASHQHYNDMQAFLMKWVSPVILGTRVGSGWFRWQFWNQNIDLEWIHEDSNAGR